MEHFRITALLIVIISMKYKRRFDWHVWSINYNYKLWKPICIWHHSPPCLASSWSTWILMYLTASYLQQLCKTHQQSNKHLLLKCQGDMQFFCHQSLWPTSKMLLLHAFWLKFSAWNKYSLYLKTDLILYIGSRNLFLLILKLSVQSLSAKDLSAAMSHKFALLGLDHIVRLTDRGGPNSAKIFWRYCFIFFYLSFM